MIFDRLRRDFNTRFSGVTDENYRTAVLPLKAIRRSLDAFINSQTIMIGHALDNDLKTLRMIHHRCVDTTALYLHRSGPPYRKKLRDLYVIRLLRMPLIIYLLSIGLEITWTAKFKPEMAMPAIHRWRTLSQLSTLSASSSSIKSRSRSPHHPQLKRHHLQKSNPVWSQFHW